MRFRLGWARTGMPARAIWIRVAALLALVLVGLVT